MSTNDLLAFDDIYPVTIVPDRYGGSYSDGQWLCFPTWHDRLPPEPFSGDVEASTWWQENKDLPIGLGSSPDLAYADLFQRLEALPARSKHPAVSERSGHMWTWEIPWPSGEVTVVDRMWRGEGKGPGGEDTHA